MEPTPHIKLSPFITGAIISLVLCMIVIAVAIYKYNPNYQESVSDISNNQTTAYEHEE